MHELECFKDIQLTVLNDSKQTRATLWATGTQAEHSQCYQWYGLWCDWLMSLPQQYDPDLIRQTEQIFNGASCYAAQGRRNARRLWS